MKPWSDCRREHDDAASEFPDCGTSSEDDTSWPGSWAGLALWIGWCFFGVVAYGCFADTAPHIALSELSLLDGFLVALLLGPLAAVTCEYWLQHEE